MLVHDIVKMKLVHEGYLPNYPYHLISNAEMCDAFMCVSKDPFTKLYQFSGWFYDTYRCLSDTIKHPYELLGAAIYYYIDLLKHNAEGITLPDWVYSYMLGSVVSIHSSVLDIHDLISPLGVDNIDDIFTPAASIACYNVSKEWLVHHNSRDFISLPKDNVVYQNKDAWNLTDSELKSFDLRPPTMFGEPHVIKSIRLTNVTPVY